MTNKGRIIASTLREALETAQLAGLDGLVGAWPFHRRAGNPSDSALLDAELIRHANALAGGNAPARTNQADALPPRPHGRSNGCSSPGVRLEPQAPPSASPSPFGSKNCGESRRDGANGSARSANGRSSPSGPANDAPGIQRTPRSEPGVWRQTAGACAPPGRIFIIGFMGVGKSTEGRILAEMLGRRFIDLDDVIEERTAMTVPRIFEEQGEDGYRAIEARTLEEVVEATAGAAVVIASGGGIVCRPRNRLVLQTSGLCILLVADLPTIFERIRGSSRPLLKCDDPFHRLQTLFEERKPAYACCADWVIQTRTRKPEDVCRALCQEIHAAFGLPSHAGGALSPEA